ncbi:MAG TPA: ABC transporter permease [Bacteroidales bacterium]|nr:ABC transporter permease [Bacteroidales bacterium]HSA42227.1 ABC transporter permease [Bacteroidales bacterium]
MKKFLGFVRKEFHHIFRDRRTLLILFGMPVVQLLLFGYVIVNDLRNARIAVLDLASDQVSREITGKIISSGFFRLVTYLESERDIHEVLKQGQVREVIIFEKDFARKLQSDGRAAVQVIADASEPNTARMMVNYTQGILMSYTLERNRNLPQAAAIIPEVRMEYNPELKGVYMFVPGIIAMLLTLICTLLTSIAITREKELGTMEVLLVSPLRPVQIILGKVTPYLLLSLLNAMVILLMANLVFGVPVVGSVVLLLAMTMLYILTALSLGILISSLTGSQQVAMMISMVGLLLPTILLSGFIYPIENMPLWLQAICHVMPPKYFITIMKDIMLMGNGLMYFWKEAVVLLFMTAVFIILSVKKFKIRLS